VDDGRLKEPLVSDFLVTFDHRCSGEQLLELLGRPYGSRARAGRFVDFPWGSMAVLEEPLAHGRNILAGDGRTIAWVGDLVTPATDAFLDALVQDVLRWRAAGADRPTVVASAEAFRQLDGAFALLVADEHGPCLLTDLLSSLQVYAGYDRSERLCVWGTHQDLTAILTDRPWAVDCAAAAEFLDSGGICFPRTMHGHVRRLNPASVHGITFDNEGGARAEATAYWHPPRELTQYDEDELASELRGALVEAVSKRCGGRRIAVALSGGLDSRLLMATVPASVECLGLTFCDAPNRETRTARRVSACYGRAWYPLFRDPAYVGNTVETIARFIGCEGWFVHAHAMGLAEEIARHQVDAVLSGINMDTYLKCYTADDMVRVRRLAGLLPPRYLHREIDFPEHVAEFWRSHLHETALAGLRKHREDFLRCYGDPHRSSAAEWRQIYPVLYGFASWPAERRLLPSKLPVLDRRLIEFCFKCPVTLKVGGRVFSRATRASYGRGARIPSANDGVRPGSGHGARLVQRAVRRLQDRTVGVLEKLGREPRIEHSWHDYRRQWRENPALEALRNKYGVHLDRLDGLLFRDSGQALLRNREIFWEHGFRLLQLAVWLGVTEEYRAARSHRPA
jgi:asparagine synthetase B (glutamine-hydrolysing)